MAPQFFYRRLRFFTWCFTLIASCTSVCVYAQGTSSNDPSYNTYAVIGAFTVENNAQRLVELVKQFDLKATIRNNEHRGLYYVYIAESPNRTEIKEQINDLRKNYTQFYDAWAYTGDFTDKPEPKKEIANSNTESRQSDNQMIAASDDSTQADEKISTKVDAKDESQEFKKEEGHYYLYFNTINSKNLKEVKGNIKIVDPERAKQLMEAKSHELVDLEDPDNGTRRVIVATDIFGFREVQHTLDLDDPASLTDNPDVELRGDSIIVNFDLKRFKKGDVLIMYNVYFFKDAAIMKPESIYELNSLLDMLKENDNLVVKIHGHTNGNSHGKIIHLDLEDKNFFSIHGEHKESYGSAKKLSLFRAYTIQHWLMAQGITEDRMEIKGWGGKRMIYDKFSPQAEKNVRVEIEILQE